MIQNLIKIWSNYLKLDSYKVPLLFFAPVVGSAAVSETRSWTFPSPFFLFFSSPGLIVLSCLYSDIPFWIKTRVFLIQSEAYKMDFNFNEFLILSI